MKRLEKAKELIKEALDNIDSGGEQSREFKAEIQWLREARRILNSITRKKPRRGK